MIYLSVRDRDAAAQATEPITSGSVGMRVGFSFSESWDGLAKVAVFRGSGQSIDVALTAGSCEVPHEVLQSAGGHLKIGVYGTGDEGQKVTPTVWADAGPIVEGAEPSEIEPTPATESLVQQILEAAEDARDLAQSVRDDADDGEFDGQNGADGNSLWWTVSLISDASMPGQVYGKIRSSWLKGRSGAPAVHDLVVGPAVGTSGSIVWLYEIDSVAGIYCNLKGIGSIKGAPGEDGFAPEVTIEQIDGGHRVTITSAAHPEGQSFDVMNGSGGSVTVDAEISGTSENPVQNKVIKAALDEKADASDVPTKTSDLQNDSGFLTQHQSLAAYRTAAAQDTLDSQKAPAPLVVTCTFTSAAGGTCNKNTSEIKAAMDAGAVVYFSGAMPGIGSVKYLATGYTDTGSSVAVAAQAVGEPHGAFYDFFMPYQDAGYYFLLAERKFLDTDLGSINAGKFLVVGSDGVVVPTTMTAWQGGSY